ncbi:MAG: hypothetical protein KatS3mg054_0055 [Chloroflexus sp.]|nr:MAG: hypothetical protein KatS3mg054_0055 [Chloroflexus sp.]
MAKVKKRNQAAQAPLSVILTGTQNMALASGNWMSSPSSLNIADGQLGVISADPDGTVVPKNFLGAGVTINDVRMIQIVRGTPASQNLSMVNPYNYPYGSVLATQYIDGERIEEVHTVLPTVGRHDLTLIGTVGAVAAATNYRLNIVIESVDVDVQYAPSRRNILPFTYTTPATLPAQPVDLLLQNLAFKANTDSLLLNRSGRPYVVLGINTAGGAGTALNTIAEGTTIPYIVTGSVTQSFRASKELVQALQDAVSAGALAATATVQVIDISTAGTAANVNALLVVGLHEPGPLQYDELSRVQTILQVGFNGPATVRKIVAGKDWQGTGFQLQFYWKQRAASYHNGFNAWYGHDLIPSKQGTASFIDPSRDQLYTCTKIIYRSGEQHYPDYSKELYKEALILIPASITNPTAAVGAATPPYQVATANATLVTSLNSVLGAWLASTNAKFNGAATPAAPFV